MTVGQNIVFGRSSNAPVFSFLLTNPYFIRLPRSVDETRYDLELNKTRLDIVFLSFLTAKDVYVGLISNYDFDVQTTKIK